MQELEEQQLKEALLMSQASEKEDEVRRNKGELQTEAEKLK